MKIKIILWLLAIITWYVAILVWNEKPKYLNPNVKVEFIKVEAKMVEKVLLEGKASYYSESGCLGCSETLTMANGERFDEDEYTIAIGLVYDGKVTNRPLIALNKFVKIRNIDNGKEIVAKVTDTGGFHSPRFNYRIADLSLATAKAIDLKTNVSTIQIVDLMQETPQSEF